MIALLGCVDAPVAVESADTGNAAPVVEWASASIVTDADTTMEVIVSDADGAEDVAGAVVYWVLDDYVTAEIPQTSPSEHADGRVYFTTRHPSPSPYNGFEVIATDAAGSTSRPYVVELGG